MGKVFVSYAHDNKVHAAKIADRLRSLGFDVWIDEKNLLATDDISTAIDSQIANVDAVLVLWSTTSRESVWVRGEALRGLESDKYLGAMLDRITPPVPFNTRSAPDLSEWTGLHQHSGWDRLVRGLAEMSPSSKSAVTKALDDAQGTERAEEAKAAAAQVELPFEDAETMEPLPAGPTYKDVDALISAAKGILATASKLDLAAAITQAALDEEMLRDAAFVVSCNGETTAPKPASCPILPSIQAALDRARAGDLIAVLPGHYDENIKIEKDVRLVGLGWLDKRPVIAAKRKDNSAVVIDASARLENFVIETRHRYAAIYCVSGRAVVLRCVVSRFGPRERDNETAVYIAKRANPIIMATSITSSGAPAVLMVGGAGGEFLGVNILASRAAAVTCKGKASFRGCTIEAVGGHAVEVTGWGWPTFEDCEISGRGASVVRIGNSARPSIRDSRVMAIRQLAFDFDGDASGRYERNIVQHEADKDAGTARTEKPAFFAILKSKENKTVKAASKSAAYIALRGKGKPLFIANTLANGEAIPDPHALADATGAPSAR